MAEYPQDRDAFFAHKVARLLLRTCAAQEISPAACWLVSSIAHTEDAKRYTDAVTFWNDQLQSVLGFSSGKLYRARKRAIKGGWLHYEPGGKGKVGRYWATIPPNFTELSDRAVDEDDPIILSTLEEETQLSSSPVEREAGGNPVILSTSGRKAGEKREESGRETGGKRETSEEHSSLSPKPRPKPCFVEKSQEFYHLWESASRLPGIAAVRNWTPGRKKKLQVRLNENGWWEAFQEAVGKLPLPGDGWQPDADWFLANGSNVYKVLEGKYDWRAGKGKQPDQAGFDITQEGLTE